MRKGGLSLKDDPKRLARVKRAYLSFGRLADFRKKFGGKHPPEKGVSDKPFFNIPTDDHSAENHSKKAIDFVKDIEIGDPLSGGDRWLIKLGFLRRRHVSSVAGWCRKRF